MSADYFASDVGTYPWYINTFPAGVYDPITNKTWIAWEAVSGSNRLAKVRVFDHTTGQWGAVVTAGTNSSLPDDDHGVPAICRDYQGYWWVFFGAHLSALHISVTTNPDDPSAWTSRPTLTTSGGVTYPHPMPTASGIDLYLRDTFSGLHKPLCMFQTTSLNNGVETWGSVIQLADFGNLTWFYQSGAFFRNGTEDHFLGTLSGDQQTVPETYRRGVYYFIRNRATNDISNIDKSFTTVAASLPITLAALNAHYLVLAEPTAGGSTNIPIPAFDAAGRPHVILSDGAIASTTNTMYHMAYESGSWTPLYTLGSANSNVNDYWLVPAANGGMTAYWSQVSSPPYTVDGDLWSATRSSGGTWGSSALFRASDGVQANAVGQQVLNGHRDLRMFFGQISQSASHTGAPALLKWAYGDRGYVGEDGLPVIHSVVSQIYAMQNMMAVA